MSLNTLSTLSTYNGYNNLLNNEPIFSFQQQETLPTQQQSIFNMDYTLRNIDGGYNTLASLQQNLLNTTKEPTYINTLKGVSLGINTLASLGSLWLGFKNYSLAKKQLGIAKEQWNQTKQELNRIKTLREHLTQEYMNGE